MTSLEFQCNGTTKANQRCKIRVHSSSGYCHYHITQAAQGDHVRTNVHLELVSPKRSTPSRSWTPSPVKLNPSEKYTRGFIYMYTLEHLLQSSPKKQDWLLVRPAGKDSATPFDPKKDILIKVGLTQGSVEKRLKQWEKQCSHKLTSVDPYNLPQRKRIGLTALFKNLRIDRKITDNGDEITKDLKYYREDGQGFYCETRLYDIEQSIHRFLRTQYGRGDVKCHGCKKDSALGHGVHIEWFKVPRKDLRSIFLFIDTLVSPY